MLGSRAFTVVMTDPPLSLRFNPGVAGERLIWAAGLLVLIAGQAALVGFLRAFLAGLVVGFLIAG
jgi:hypothetical protein